MLFSIEEVSLSLPLRELLLWRRPPAADAASLSCEPCLDLVRGDLLEARFCMAHDDLPARPETESSPLSELARDEAAGGMYITMGDLVWALSKRPCSRVAKLIEEPPTSLAAEPFIDPFCRRRLPSPG